MFPNLNFITIIAIGSSSHIDIVLLSLKKFLFGIMMNALTLVILLTLFIIASSPILALSGQEKLELDTEKTFELSKQIAKFYEMPENTDILEITEKLLESPHVKKEIKESILQSNRKIFVFIYPSDGLKIKGYISFVPKPEQFPLSILLRGGNNYFGLPNPGNDFTCMNNHTAISTTYRGGLSEGKDEYGGADVNDVKNLIDFIPTLEEKLQSTLQKDQLFLVGGSRGGMQMFLTLSRFPEIQKRISKIVSLCGILDMRSQINHRPDLRDFFIKDMGLIQGVNEEEWINFRDPLLAVKNIRSDLPVLIIQAGDDLRVSIDQGYSMVKELEANGNPVTYWEFEDGDHCLQNREDRAKLVEEWLN